MQTESTNKSRIEHLYSATLSHRNIIVVTLTQILISIFVSKREYKYQALSYHDMLK